MSENLLFPVPERFKERAWMDEEAYRRDYARSISDPEGFWAEQARRLQWIRTPERIRDVSYGPREVRIRWFEDGLLNASVNCLDRHLPERAERTALIWEGDDPSEIRTLNYAELHKAVCQLAGGLRALGVKKGDRVAIYMPMVAEAVVAMLACARIGAIHSVVFAGFSAESLAGRIRDCGARLLITADEGCRGGRRISLKENADAALKTCPSVERCVVLKRTDGKINWVEGRDLWYHVY